MAEHRSRSVKPRLAADLRGLSVPELVWVPVRDRLRLAGLAPALCGWLCAVVAGVRCICHVDSATDRLGEAIRRVAVTRRPLRPSLSSALLLAGRHRCLPDLPPLRVLLLSRLPRLEQVFGYIEPQPGLEDL